jgi:hypothetical protein
MESHGGMICTGKKRITRIIRSDSVNEENIKHPVSALMSKGGLKVPDSEGFWFDIQQVHKRNQKT